MTSFLAIATSMTAVVSGLLSLYALYRIWPYTHMQGRRAQMVFWGIVLCYGIGKAFEVSHQGGDFLRYHLNDFGFIAAWGGIIYNPDRSQVFRFGHVIVPDRKPIYDFRIGITLALLAGIVWELFTAHVIHLGRPLPGYHGYDWWDTAMYLLAFAILWPLAGRMWVPRTSYAPRSDTLYHHSPTVVRAGSRNTAPPGLQPNGRPKPAPTSRTGGPARGSGNHHKSRR
jgi:hypothetical protein